jgi:hypothetical protein
LATATTILEDSEDDNWNSYAQQTRILENNNWHLTHQWHNPNSSNKLGLWYRSLDPKKWDSDRQDDIDKIFAEQKEERRRAQ